MDVQALFTKSINDPYILGALVAICLAVVGYSSSSGLTARVFKEEFPDYFALSGVPLPQPVEEFDIDKAKPRPYRPFRWDYHQHMGMPLTFPCNLDNELMLLQH